MTRADSSRQATHIGVVVIAALAAIVVFAPWRPPGFVSDSWYLLLRFGALDATGVLGRFVPTAGEWYRPLTDAFYWLSWQTFGLDPAGSFALHVVSHVAAASVLGMLTHALTRHRVASVVTAVAALFALQAHEVVWDHSAVHFSLVAVPLVGAVLAYVRGMRRLSLLLAVVALLADEAGLLVPPLVVLYEFLYTNWRRPGWRTELRPALVRVAPFAALVALYLGARLAVGGFYNEVADPCRAPSCFAVGMAEYANRLVVRPDPLMALVWTHRLPVFAAVAVLLGVAAVVLRPWRWSDPRPALFGLGWAAGASLFFILALFPYVADRFVYIPQMGVSAVIGGVVAQLGKVWRTSGPAWRVASAVLVALLVVWVGLGAYTLFERGQRWVAAGDRALVLAEGVNRLVPDPQAGTVVLLYGQPHSLDPPFPPGNTGPYVYLNGMQSAMQLLYGWPSGVIVPRRAAEYLPSLDAIVISLEIVGDVVIRR